MRSDYPSLSRQGESCFDGNASTAIVFSAMTAARAAQRLWRRLPIRRRLEKLAILRALIAENAVRLAEASAFARNRPVEESMTAEVLPLIEACAYLERNASRLLAPKRHGLRGLPLWLHRVRSEVHYEPLGVILIIGPGNYPLLLPGAQIIQALAAGNAVLLKPGVGGEAAASTLRELVLRAGLDDRLMALLPGSVEAATAAIEAKPDKVLFTGSAATGEKIMAQLARHITPSTMELSGCDAVVVCDDADLELTSGLLRFALTLNNGATCMAPKRVFVSQAVSTEMEGRLEQLFRSNSVAGSGSCGKPGVLVASEQLRQVVEDALSLGAHFIVGDLPKPGAPAAPIVLGGVSVSSAILKDDVFAPVLALVSVKSDAEAVSLLNDCPYALGASVFSRDLSRARGIADQIDAGVVSINDLIVPSVDPRLPFGGRRRSGFGVTRGAEGLLELTVPKVITVSCSSFRPALVPTLSGDAMIFNAFINLKHGRGIRARWRALLALISRVRARRQIENGR